KNGNTADGFAGMELQTVGTAGGAAANNNGRIHFQTWNSISASRRGVSIYEDGTLRTLSNNPSTNATYKTIGYSDSGKEIRRYFFSGTLPVASATTTLISVGGVDFIISNRLNFQRTDRTVPNDQWHSVASIPSNSNHVSILHINAGNLNLYGMTSIATDYFGANYKGYVEVQMR